MNLTQWRSAVQEQAGRLRERLSNLVRQTEQLAPGVIYGATAGAELLRLDNEKPAAVAKLLGVTPE